MILKNYLVLIQAKTLKNLNKVKQFLKDGKHKIQIQFIIKVKFIIKIKK